jgi:hypothetical protein
MINPEGHIPSALPDRPSPRAVVSVAELVDYLNRRRHNKCRAGTICPSSAGRRWWSTEKRVSPHRVRTSALGKRRNRKLRQDFTGFCIAAQLGERCIFRVISQ